MALNQNDRSYRRNLPHIHPEGATYHIVFRIEGSLPDEVVEQLRELRQRYKEEGEQSVSNERSKRLRRMIAARVITKYADLLDGHTRGPRWLVRAEIAQIVHQAILYGDGRLYDLHASTIMPNHVHLVAGNFRMRKPGMLFVPPDSSGDQGNIGQKDNAPQTEVCRTRPPRGTEVSEALRLLKGSTARACNLVLGRQGGFWHHESYDHVIRDEGEFLRTVMYVLQNPVRARLVRDWKDWPWTYVRSGLGSRSLS